MKLALTTFVSFYNNKEKFLETVYFDGKLTNATKIKKNAPIDAVRFTSKVKYTDKYAPSRGYCNEEEGISGDL